MSSDAPAPNIVLVINERLRLPGTIRDLESFRQWARSDDCPEKGHFAYLAGTFWVDLTLEQAYTHNQVKTEFIAVLHPLVKTSDQGRYLGDGMLLSNPAADLSTTPDGMFVSYHAFDSGRVCEVSGRQSAGVIELEGTPDMVLEVLSESSVQKDMVDLPRLYAKAGIPEFWRADARHAEVRFEILRLTEQGHVPAQPTDGWWPSGVFGRSFRLLQASDRRGRPTFTLESRV
jgi:Uma2 family endonuclease